MAVSVAARDFSIVVLGDFNPAILHPSWFAAQGLIKNGEALEAKVEVVHREMAVWSIDWAKVYSDGDRLQLTSEQEAYFEPLRDLVIGVLTLLEHTPVRAVGLNAGGYYQFSDLENYHRFGHEIAPKDRWKSLLEPGTQRLTITSAHANGRRGNLNVTVSASNRFPFCAHVSANDHSELPSGSSGPGSKWAREHISNQWLSVRERFEEIVRNLTEGF